MYGLTCVSRFRAKLFQFSIRLVVDDRQDFETVHRFAATGFKSGKIDAMFTGRDTNKSVVT